MNAIRTYLSFLWQRFSCRLQHAVRVRRDLRDLSRMSAYELRDLGISHAALAGSTPRIDVPCA